MNVTDELSDWEDSRIMDRKRQWFTIEDALEQLALHKPVQRSYLQQLKNLKNLTTASTSTISSANVLLPMTTTTTTTTIEQTTITSNNSETTTNCLPTPTAIQIQSTTN